MRVVALKPRFYGGSLRPVGAVFDMDETKFKKDKRGPILPSGVIPFVSEEKAKAAAEAAKKAEIDRQRDGAIAASGGAAAKEKIDDIAQNLAG